MILRLFAIALLAVLAACTKPVVFAPDAEVQAARYRHAGPTELVLYDVVRNASGGGEHAALLINASERVLFDPAGSWTHPEAPERHDVHHGITPRMLQTYLGYHSSFDYHVMVYRLQVTPAVAERVKQLAQAYGPVPDAQCARSIGTILRQVPGFEGIADTWYPSTLAASFATLPGVEVSRIDGWNEPTAQQTYRPNPA